MVGIYLGQSQFLHAVKAEGMVTVSTLKDSFLKKDWLEQGAFFEYKFEYKSEMIKGKSVEPISLLLFSSLIIDILCLKLK